MESFFSRYRNALVLIVVLVAQLLALAVQAKRPAADGADRPSVSLLRFAVVSVITPPERLLHSTGRGIRSLWFGYFDLVHVRRENANLRQEVQRLRLEQASIAQDADQARRLQQVLGFSEHYINKTMAAQVIGTGGTDQSQVLYIDKGSDDGLQQDMPVITADGIVGKVKDVFPHTSQVLLVTDPTSGVGVILETTRIRGILKGRAYGEIQVSDISPDSRVKPGEPIVTSGGDQIFPRGLSVGTVERVIPDPDRDPLVNVLVHPSAKLAQLEEVLVITGLSDTISAQQSQDLAESELEGEAAQKRASDVLSERLPSRVDPNAPADTNPEQLVDAAGNALPKAPPPKPEHPDSFSPNAEPSAEQMIPGRRWAAVKDGTEEVTTAKQSSSSSTATQPAAVGLTDNRGAAVNSSSPPSHSEDQPRLLSAHPARPSSASATEPTSQGLTPVPGSTATGTKSHKRKAVPAGVVPQRSIGVTQPATNTDAPNETQPGNPPAAATPQPTTPPGERR